MSRPMEEDANRDKNEEEKLNTGPLSVQTSVKNNTQEADWESVQEKRDWRKESIAYRRLSQRLTSSIDRAIEKLEKMDEEDSSEEEADWESGQEKRVSEEQADWESGQEKRVSEEQADWESGQETRDWREESAAFRRLSQRLTSSIDRAVEKLEKMEEEDSSEEEG